MVVAKKDLVADTVLDPHKDTYKDIYKDTPTRPKIGFDAVKSTIDGKNDK